jgi:hypothetical protein
MSKVNVAGLERATQEVNTISQSDIYFLLTYGIKESEVVPCLMICTIVSRLKEQSFFITTSMLM